jgi:5-methyltetrahydrofolate--homocysteine methyltransferase
VQDASQSVPVVSRLITDSSRQAFVEETKTEYARIRTNYSRRSNAQTYRSLEEARAEAYKIDWEAAPITVPNELGVTVLHNYPLSKLRDYIDWTPFFLTWELRGGYPTIFDKPGIGEEARRVFDDANRLLDRIIDEDLLQANGVFGLFPANSVGDDIEVYADPSRSQLLTMFYGLRQQEVRIVGKPSRNLADFIAPRDSGRIDYVGGFVVTAGHGLDELVASFERDHDDYNAIMAKALADRLAEAFAERLHERVRTEFWGYAPDEALNKEALLKENFTGIRPAAGYPASPDHTEKITLFDLLNAEEATSVSLTESCAMWPGASVSGLYFAHPEAHYFNVGKIGKNQVVDYAARKGMSVEAVEKWLAPNLNYEPELVPVPEG